MSRRLTLPGLICALHVLMAGCQPQPGLQPGQQTGAVPEASSDQQPWPAFDYALARVEGSTVWKLDPESSRIDILVTRDGPLARFGHDHVIVAARPEGWLMWAPGPNDSPNNRRADLRISVDRLETDREDARKHYRLDTEPTPSEIEGTRQNMMESVLQADQWPWLFVKAERIDGTLARPVFHAEITIRGRASQHVIELAGVKSENGVTFTGSLPISQTDLGIEPFSTLGGALRVADELTIHLRLAGQRL